MKLLDIYFEDSSGNQVDVLTRLTGTQPIRTYTIGFQAPRNAEALMAEMAVRGDGRAYSVTTYDQLTTAFEEIIANIVGRSRVAFSPGTAQVESFFTDNYMYVSDFRPTEIGHWRGNTKKYCIIPLSSSDNSCMFLGDPDDQDTLRLNLYPRDMWSGSVNTNAAAGGAGDVMLQQLFEVQTTGLPPPSNPLNRRTILTWRPGTAAYVPVNANSLSLQDTWSNTTCLHNALINSIHGFTQAVTDCASANYAPVAFDSWPIGDTSNAGNVLLKYSEHCESPTDTCYVVSSANDGMLHFYDAVSGVETSALIPGEFWRPNNVAKNILHERDNQPTLDITRRFYLDGKISLYHIDANLNSIIDNGEKAYLSTGMGRGGRAYYLFDVSTFDGVPDATDNPPLPLMADSTTGFKHLQETWSPPSFGKTRMPDGTSRDIAVFPSGHINELDAPTTTMPRRPVLDLPTPMDTESSPYSASCATLSIPEEVCSTPEPARFCEILSITCTNVSSCTPCTDNSIGTCQSRGRNPPYCYDWPGLDLLSPDVGGLWADNPHNFAAGPFRYQTSSEQGIAYRINFSRLQMQRNDSIMIYDDEQNEVARFTGSYTGAVSSPWIYTESFTLRVVTDGVDDSAALGYAISHVDVIRETIPDPASTNLAEPNIYVVDLSKWNGPNATESLTSSDPQVFSAQPSDNRQADALLFRITRECTEPYGQSELCIDQNTNSNTTDLQYFICPVSMKLSIYTEGNFLRAIYFGDECGQIWVAEYDNNFQWRVKRLLRTNNADDQGDLVSGAAKNFRKIYAPIDIVISTCSGQRAVGVYFGTGDLQRAGARDALADASVAGLSNTVYGTVRDVIGVVWDTPQLPNNAGLEDLVNATNIDEVTSDLAGQSNGWFIELNEQERMLRSPLVFDRLAHFDMFRPTVAATECSPSQGESRAMIMNNCTALGFPHPQESTADLQRQVSIREESTIGGGFMLLTPPHKDPIVTLGQDSSEDQAVLPRRGESKLARLLLWRL